MQGADQLHRTRVVLFALLCTAFLIRLATDATDVFTRIQAESLSLLATILIAGATIALVHIFIGNSRLTLVMLVAGVAAIFAAVLYFTAAFETLNNVPIWGRKTTSNTFLTDLFDWISLSGAFVAFYLIVFSMTNAKIELTQKSESLEREMEERKRAVEQHERLEVQLRQTQKLETIGVLAGGIAHDFNNILMGILGNATLLLEDHPEKSATRDKLRQIEKAANHAADLTDQMLTYAGKSRVSAEPVNISSVVREMADLLTLSISKRADLQISLDEELPSVLCDIGQFRQIILNLTTNASEALEDENGSIRVETGVGPYSKEYLAQSYTGEILTPGDYVYLKVSDTGVGMDDEALTKIFDPFFSTKFTGRGLGLSTVLGIVRGHKGAVHLDSQQGVGTEFTILFPQSSDVALPIKEITATALPKDISATILVVDDEEVVRDIAQKILERAGYSILLAKDGAESVEKYHDHADEIDLVLMDVTMPRMDGHEAMENIRAINSEARIVLTSGLTQDQVNMDAPGNGLVGFIHKPYSSNRLITLIGSCLDQQESAHRA